MSRERPSGFPLVHVGLDLSLEEGPECLAEELVFVALDHRETIPPALFTSSVGSPLHCELVTDVVVDVQHDDGVRTLTLNSPANRNALSERLLAQLEVALRDATSDPDVRAVVLTGTGTVFCSGADLSERGTAAPNRMPAILSSMVESAVPIIVRVNGHARAGGIGLVAAADMAVATTDATFAFTEVRVGVAPAMILVPALRVVDRRFLTRATLTGERFGAAEAVGAGLLTAVTPDEVALDAWVADRTTALRQAAPAAVRATKALLRTLPAQAWAEGLAAAAATSADLFAGDEAAEGMDAFLQKRRPAWDTTP
jgi:enoyl-CoA hydratase/carnithine racemase